MKPRISFYCPMRVLDKPVEIDIHLIVRDECVQKKEIYYINIDFIDSIFNGKDVFNVTCLKCGREYHISREDYETALKKFLESN